MENYWLNDVTSSIEYPKVYLDGKFYPYEILAIPEELSIRLKNNPKEIMWTSEVAKKIKAGQLDEFKKGDVIIFPTGQRFKVSVVKDKVEIDDKSYLVIEPHYNFIERMKSLICKT